MTEFLQALSQHAFLQHALAAGLLASVGCGVVGTYGVVTLGGIAEIAKSALASDEQPAAPRRGVPDTGSRS